MHHEVEEVKIGQDAVPVGDVASKGVASALLPADHGLHLQHLGGHVLEAYPGLVHRHVVNLPQLIQNRGGGEGLDDRPSLTPHLQEIQRQQAVDLQLVDEAALLIAYPDAVGVAVVDDSHVGS